MSFADYWTELVRSVGFAAMLALAYLRVAWADFRDRVGIA